MRWFDDITGLINMSLSKLREGDGEGQINLANCSPWGHKK